MLFLERVGSEFIDVLIGGTGDDTLSGLGGSDDLRGNSGDDLLIGGSDGDNLHGNQGNDIIHGGNNVFSDINAVAPDTTLDTVPNTATDTALNDHDFIRGGKGSDTIYGNTGNDTIYGDRDNDFIWGGKDQGSIEGGDGIDNIFGDKGHDTLQGNAGDDVIRGGEGNDIIRGGKGDDIITGGEGSDTIYGDLGTNMIFGGGGTDIVVITTDTDTPVLGSNILGAVVSSVTFADYEEGVDEVLFEGAGLSVSDVSVASNENGGATITLTGNNVVREVILEQVEASNIAVQLIDNGSSSSGEQTSIQVKNGNIVSGSAVTVSNSNPGPTILGMVSSVTFLENTVNAAAQLVDSDIALSDGNSTDFEGGSVTITYHSGGGAEDTLSITDGGNVTVVGNDIRVSGISVGTITANGAAGSNLAFNLNANATPARIEEVLERLSYANSSNTPVASRAITITTNDGDGGTATKQVTINVTAEDDLAAFTSTPVEGQEVGSVYTYNVTVDITVGVTLTATLEDNSPLPGWLGFTDNSNGTGTLTGTPLNGSDEGLHQIKLTATTGAGPTTQSFHLFAADATFWGTTGNDNLTGTAGAEAIGGNEGNDTITTGGNSDTVHGGSGDDSITSSPGFVNDLVYGGSGNDTINSDSGSDTVHGGDGNDSIDAGVWHDTVYGGNGNDTINGGDHNDILYGEAGNDLLTGGSGVNTFVFTQEASATDTITDFDATNDSEDIDVSAIGGITTLADMTPTQMGGDTHLDLGNGHTLILTGVTVGDLHNADFVF